MDPRGEQDCGDPEGRDELRRSRDEQCLSQRKSRTFRVELVVEASLRREQWVDFVQRCKRITRGARG